MRWRLLHDPPLDGPSNMALDEALMARARRTGETVFRTYAWARPTLSLGRNQRAAGMYDDRAMERAGVAVVRRPTGGRALLHHREVTYSVTAPLGDGDAGIRQAYGRINALLLAALRRLGVPADESPPATRALPPTHAPCFAEPAAGELTVHGRKLVGSAQWRDEGALLQHGSILLADDQTSIPSLMRAVTDAPPPPATLATALGRDADPAEVVSALVDAVRALADSEASPLALDAETSRHAERLRAWYRDPAWTWRR